MKYVGSKARLVKYIAPIIQSYIDENNIKKYWEPFVGGTNLITHIKCKERFGSDINPYLIALLKQMQIDTSIFPQTVSEAEYKAVQTSRNDYPDWYVGFVGFGSFGGKFFGGYPRGFKIDGVTPRNYFNEHYRALKIFIYLVVILEKLNLWKTLLSIVTYPIKTLQNILIKKHFLMKIFINGV